MNMRRERRQLQEKSSWEGDMRRDLGVMAGLWSKWTCIHSRVREGEEREEGQKAVSVSIGKPISRISVKKDKHKVRRLKRPV